MSSFLPVCLSHNSKHKRLNSLSNQAKCPPSKRLKSDRFVFPPTPSTEKQAPRGCAWERRTVPEDQVTRTHTHAEHLPPPCISPASRGVEYKRAVVAEESSDAGSTAGEVPDQGTSVSLEFDDDLFDQLLQAEGVLSDLDDSDSVEEVKKLWSDLDVTSLSSAEMVDLFSDLDIDFTDDSSGHISLDQLLQAGGSVKLATFLAHFVSSKNGLSRCSSQNCGLFAPPGGILCRQCGGESHVGVFSSPSLTAPSETEQEVAVESEAYAALLASPCSSPTKESRPYERFNAVSRLANFSSSFVNMIESKNARLCQLPSIPVVVYVIMQSLGFPKRDVESRKIVCDSVLDGKLPRFNKFFFSRMQGVGSSQDDSVLLRRLSVALWASLFVLDIIAFSEASNEPDKLANLFFCDTKLVDMENGDFANLLAALGYGSDISSRVYAHYVYNWAVHNNGVFSETKESGLVQKLSRGGREYDSVRIAVKAPLIQSVLNGALLVGFSPEFKEVPDTRMNAFFEACSASGGYNDVERRLRRYLQTMMGNRPLVAVDEVLDVMVTRKHSSILIFPLFMLVHTMHLQRTVFSDAENEAFDFRFVGSGGGARGSFPVVRSNGEEIIEPSFSDFKVKASPLYETDLAKMLLSTFQESAHVGLLGSDADVFRCKALPFSLDFSPLVGKALWLESLMTDMKAFPEKYRNDTCLKSVLCEFGHVIVDVISFSGIDALATARDTASLTAAESLF